MQIRILFDKTALSRRFSTGWGFSCLIDNSILFDTGENGKHLFSNMKKMDIDISAIKTVVISHDHWDHTRGLWEFLEKQRGISVYAGPEFDNSFRKNVKMLNADIIENKAFCQIKRNIYTTGEIAGKYKGSYLSEQALVLKTRKGVTIITGCAHPGIIKIIETVKKNISGDIYLVLGGFHLIDKHDRTIKFIANKFRELNVKKIAPSHCTGETATELFKEEYADDFIEVKVGQTIEI